MRAEIERHVKAFLTGKASIMEFEDWFLPATWELTSGTDVPAYELASALRLRLAEFDLNHLDENELKEEFSRVLSAS